jgi:hypothetical protein
MRVKTIWGSWVLACLCGTLALSACGDDGGPTTGTTGATGGAAGSGGSPGSGGSSGSSGSAGSGGSSTDAGTDSKGGNGDAAPCAATEIREKLLCIPGLTIVQDMPGTGNAAGYRRFDLRIDQLVDHDNPAGPHFQQQLTLLHRDEAAPVVLASSGYSISRGTNELSRTFNANVLQVEHRYFSPSIPAAPVDWKYLTIKQSAGDYHVITQAFKTIYKGKWVNTGASKGGMTSVYHRRFHPNDLDATVAYVAPLSYGLEDARYVEFVKKVGGDMWASCRDKLNELQKTVLTRRAEVEPRMTESYAALGGPPVALEHALLEMPFTFWQYQSPTGQMYNCDNVPAADAPIATLYSWFRSVSYLSNFSDMGFQSFTPYYYQATFQLGAPGVENAHIASLLLHWDTYKPSHYIPKGVEVPAFDAEAMVDVQNWVKTEAKTIMFIYGEYDPWTSGKFEIGPTGDNHLFMAPAANHGANLARLTDADRGAALTILQNWLGVPPVMPLDATQNAFDDDAFHPRL